MAFIRRKIGFLLLLIGTVGVGLWYHFWAGGTVIARVDRGEQSFRIRKIPLPPLGIDEHAYRCEIWTKGILVRASTHKWDSYKSSTSSSISVPVGDDVVFHIGSKDITCHPYDGWGGSVWQDYHDAMKALRRNEQDRPRPQR